MAEKKETGFGVDEAPKEEKKSPFQNKEKGKPKLWEIRGGLLITKTNTFNLDNIDQIQPKSDPKGPSGTTAVMRGGGTVQLIHVDYEELKEAWVSDRNVLRKK